MKVKLIEKLRLIGSTVATDAKSVGSAVANTKTAGIVSTGATKVYKAQVTVSMAGVVDGTKEKAASIGTSVSTSVASIKAAREQKKQDREAIVSMTEKIKELLPVNLVINPEYDEEDTSL